MKIIKYVLNLDGTIPDYVVSGGFFPKSNNNPSPQDYDFIGYSEDDSGLKEYLSKSDLLNYVKKFNDLKIDTDGIKYDLINDIDNKWTNRNV